MFTSFGSPIEGPVLHTRPAFYLDKGLQNLAPERVPQSHNSDLLQKFARQQKPTWDRERERETGRAPKGTFKNYSWFRRQQEKMK